MPRLRNLRVNPVVHVLTDEPCEAECREAVLTVEGLVCRLCAARVKNALRNVPGVTKVDFDIGEDLFRVRYSSGEPLGRPLAKAAQSMVIAPRVRKFLSSQRKRKSAVSPGPS